MNVYSPLGVLAGKINQTWSIFPRFDVLDAMGSTIFKIEGPFCTCSCCCNDVNFSVLSADGSVEVGKIWKQWSGSLREILTDADSFGISFPMDLSIEMKATLIGACFLIVSLQPKSLLNFTSNTFLLVYFSRISCTLKSRAINLKSRPLSF